jgi:hypothetical protein
MNVVLPFQAQTTIRMVNIASHPGHASSNISILKSLLYIKRVCFFVEDGHQHKNAEDFDSSRC